VLKSPSRQNSVKGWDEKISFATICSRASLEEKLENPASNKHLGTRNAQKKTKTL